ncbi:hypothetical protein [Alteromonas macleodii]|uniref:hypothetical protein n=1 Tax=Alteromonas macleodii TaxID=28108 RepID=UPI0031404853
MAIIELDNFNPDLKKVLDFYTKHISRELAEAIESGEKPSWGDFRDLLITVENDPTGLALWSALTKSIRSFGAASRYSLDDLDEEILLHAQYKDIRKVMRESQMTADLNSVAERVEAAIELLSSETPSDEFRGQLVESLLSEQSFANKAFGKLKRMTLIEGDGANIPPVSLCDNIISVNHRQNIFDVAQIVPEGMSLVAVINTGRVANSYFALIVRSGTNVYYFSDEVHQSFPGQANILRTDRANISRQEMSVFPYELFDFEIIADRFLKKKDGKDLALIDEQRRHLGHIGQISGLSHERLIPLYLMLELVNEELHKKPQYPLLHTSKSLALPNKGGMGLVVSGDEPRLIEIATTNAGEVTFDSFKEKEAAAGHDVAEPYPICVFEKRYEKELSQYSLVNEDNEALVMPLPEVCYRRGLMSSVDVKTVEIPRVNSDLFGTREEVEADQYFEMRSTKAEILKAHIYDKYNREENDRLQWYKQAFLDSDVVMQVVASLSREYYKVKDEDVAFIAKYPNLKGFGGFSLNTKRSVHYRLINNGRYKFDHYSRALRNQLVGRVEGEHVILCPITGQKAVLQVEFNPHDAFGVAQLLGVERKSLPYDMEFMGFANYQGNAVLGRIDPVSNIKLPMEDEHGDITVGFSMKGLNTLRARYGLGKLTKDQMRAILFPANDEEAG